ncbi:hypothetical protein GGU10DRAFT_158676 [Lentinula aff. detonsa]|uniref:DNA replication factor Cdt1 C-terminal domain-containing protein n=1 Tax=Lentinula aff. detonsa TaxID=2804958 RepID=A0AA38NSU1_9AGAR|nr:hypothetical protein GGU10DRAFT_158676 [Lentinula aff. detonsa]
MSDIYSTLSLSPKKKRAASNFDADTFTPKKLRIAPPTPPATRTHKSPIESGITLTPHLTRLQSIQTSLQQALSHALASCAASPSSDTGVLRNVVNHISLSHYAGLTTNFTVEDLRRLCWLWEWDGSSKDKNSVEDDDNPFLDAPSPSKDWTRGSMGFVISSATQFSTAEGKRVPAYGIGIEVEIDLDKNMGAGMAAVARWTSATEMRRALFCDKLHAWAKLHADESVVPFVPLADLPALTSPSKTSSLTRVFASMSPKSSSFSLTKETMPVTPSSPSRSMKSPAKRGSVISASVNSISPAKSTILFPSTPTSSRTERTPRILNLRTPTSYKALTEDLPSEPSTPRGRDSTSILQTPTTSRRQALYDRVHQRSLSASPSKSQRNTEVPGSKLTKEQILKMGQEEMRRRCLLGRLGGVAESVWMLFSSPTGATLTPSLRKRRTLPLAEVATAIMKSSPVPISQAEANESLELLITLCPFFLKQLTIGGEEWLEMPSSLSSDPSSPSRRTPPSPGKVDSAKELMTRSPKHVKRETGGLRQVREIIRRELELHD